MARTYFGNDKKSIELKAVIAKYMILRGADRNTIARKEGWCVKTYYNKMNDPQNMTMNETWILMDHLKVPEEERIT